MRAGTKQRKWYSRARTLVLAVLIACLAAVPLTAVAGKEGVYIGENVYFTLEKVRLAEGAEGSVLRFAVRLHNGGDTPADYNRYGVRVVDDEGYFYSAQLTGQQSARVLPGKEQDFQYTSSVPSGLKAEQLMVDIYAWGGGLQMSGLGSLSVGAALEAGSEAAPEATVTLRPVDSSLPRDAQVAFRLVNEYAVYENEAWTIYANLIAENTGSAGFSLPAGLKLRLEDTSGQTVTASFLEGSDKALLPGKRQRMIVQAAVPSLSGDNPWSLQFYYTDTGSTAMLDSIQLSGDRTVSGIGAIRKLNDSLGYETGDIQVVSAIVSQSRDGQAVQASVRVANTGSSVIAMPALSGRFQSSLGGVTVKATDTAQHGAYLSPGETETFTFSALLPNGLKTEHIQLAVFETRGGAASTSSGSANSANSANTANTGAASSGSNAASGSGNNAAANAASSAAKTIPILVADLRQATVYEQGAAEYSIGEPLPLAIKEKLEVSLSEIRLYENESNGFQTAVAKIKLTNVGESALAFPDYAFQLVDEDGLVYSGTRQTNTAAQIASNSSYLVSYSFLIASADASKPMALRVYSGKDTTTGIPLSSVQVNFEQDDTRDDVWNVFPYQIEVIRDDLYHSTLSTTFSYTLSLEVKLTRKEQMISDPNMSKIQFELVDGMGQVMAIQTLPFQGTTRLLNGPNRMSFTNLKVDQYSSLNKIIVYEIVDTPNGAAKRILGEVK